MRESPEESPKGIIRASSKTESSQEKGEKEKRALAHNQSAESTSQGHSVRLSVA
jgi:hypothetical protein